MTKPFGILNVNFCECASLNQDGSSNAGQVIQIALEMGGECRRKNPLARLLPDGSLSVPFFHKLLYLPESPLNMTDLDYLADSRTVSLAQAGETEQPISLDSMAKGQIAWAKLAYPGLLPKYGFIDELGGASVTVKSTNRTEIRFIFWANFFGPNYVEKFGRNFFLDAPGWKKEELDDGGILYVVTESFYQWWTKPPREVLEYFQKQIPGIKLYRAKSSDY